MARVGYAAVFVSDMDRAVEFYEKKMGIPVRARSADFPVWVEMATDGAVLALNSAAPELIGRPTGITLVVGDIQAEYERMRTEGVRFVSPPTKQPWGGMTASVVDPDGNEIGLMEEWEHSP